MLPWGTLMAGSEEVEWLYHAPLVTLQTFLAMSSLYSLTRVPYMAPAGMALDPVLGVNLYSFGGMSWRQAAGLSGSSGTPNLSREVRKRE